MPEDEHPKPRLTVYLTLLVPVCVALCFAGCEWLSDRSAGLPVLMRALAGALLAIIPAALLASRRQVPGLTMFLAGFAPVFVGVFIPLARYNGLLSPMWASEAASAEALSAIQSSWRSAAAGAWTSAQVAATYVLVSGFWPQQSAARPGPWLGRERRALLVTGPVLALLSAGCWKLLALQVLPSDVLCWLVVALPALVLALGDSRPRRLGDLLRTISAAIACVLLLVVAGQALRAAETAARLASPGSTGSWPGPAAGLPREILVRWFIGGLLAAFSVLALLPGRVQVRRPRRIRPWIAVPVLVALAFPAFAALIPGRRAERDMHIATARWSALLESHHLHLPACTTGAPLTPGPLIVVPPDGAPQTLDSPGGTTKIAASSDTALRTLFRALPQVSSGTPVEFLVAGCKPDGIPAGVKSSGAMQRAVPATWIRKLDCPGRGETVVVMLLPGGRVRVQRNACGTPPSSPVLMELAAVRALVEGKTVVASASEDVSLGAFLEAMTRAWPLASVHASPELLDARMDQSATREMLVASPPRGSDKGVLAVLSASSSGTPAAPPEALYGPIRAAAGLHRCFEHVESDLRLGMVLELNDNGGVRSCVVEGQGTAGLASCLASQAQALSFPDAAGTTRIDVKLAWYRPALRVWETTGAFGAMTVRAEPESADTRGADVLAARLSPYFVRCIGEARQQDAELTGTATLRVCVTPTGVLQATAAESQGIPRSALECVRDSVKLIHAEPEQTPSREPACFRAISELASRQAPSVQLGFSVIEPREPGADMQNAVGALGPQASSCFEASADAGALDGELILSLLLNRRGRVMKVAVQTHGSLDRRLIQCAVEAASKLHVVAAEGNEPLAKLVMKMTVSPAK